MALLDHMSPGRQQGYVTPTMQDDDGKIYLEAFTSWLGGRPSQSLVWVSVEVLMYAHPPFLRKVTAESIFVTIVRPPRD